MLLVMTFMNLQKKNNEIIKELKNEIQRKIDKFDSVKKRRKY